MTGYALMRANALWQVLTHLRGEDFGGSPACAETDPEVFFPGPGTKSDSPAVRTAKRICGGCEVRGSCLQWALHNNESGIWGGLTESERKQLQPKRAAAEQTAA